MLLLLFVTFVFMASGPTGDWVRLVTVTLQGLTLVAALLAAGTRRRLVRIVLVLVLLAIVSAAASLVIDTSRSGDGVMFALNGLLVAGAPIAIGASMVRRRVVNVQTVLGAICIYVLIGMLAAFVYAAVADLGSGPFFAQASRGTTADFLYYSFVTLTTVGYGDLTVAGNLGRTFSILEALIGQLYLVTVLAVLVGNLSRRSDPAPDA